jgi:ParB-like chromosome segregation protein Spo0J
LIKDYQEGYGMIKQNNIKKKTKAYDALLNKSKNRIKLTDIVLKEEYKNLIPRPIPEEYEDIKKSIEEKGVEHAVILNPQKILLDGYTRYQIATELGIQELPFEIQSFSSEQDERDFIFRVNLTRRQLNTMQKLEIGMKLMAQIQGQAKERQRIHGETAPGKKKTVVGSAPTSEGKIVEIVSRQIHVSDKTLKQRNKIDTIREKIKNNSEQSQRLEEKISDALTGKIPFVDVYRTAIEIDGNDFGAISNSNEFKQSGKGKLYDITCPHCTKSFQVKKQGNKFIGA